MDNELPPEFEPLLQLLQNQSASVREVFHYAIVLMMIDDEKARFVETQSEDGKTVCLVQTITEEKFVVVKPQLSANEEQMLLSQVRQIVEESDTSAQFPFPNRPQFM